MPALKDPRQERFAVHLASGAGPCEAYEKAGYTPNRGNASRLKSAKIIRDRVMELMQETQQAAHLVQLAGFEAESSKRRAIARAYDRLAEAIEAVPILTAQDAKAISDVALTLEKDERVVTGGVSDRTATSDDTNREAIEALAELERSLRSVGGKKASVASVGTA